MINGLDLFSGIGGLGLALAEWVRPVAYCEVDKYCQAVLLSRMRSGSLPVAAVWDDVRTLNAEELPSHIDIVYGGFPCQDLSAAGLGRGLAGERSGLFWHIERLIKETNPNFVFLENVPAIRTRGLNSVVQSLTELRYDCRWTVVSAQEVGAPHLRKRWFLLAHTTSDGRDQKSADAGRDSGRGGAQGRPAGLNLSGQVVAHAHSEGLKHNSEVHEGSRGNQGRDTSPRCSWWDVEPDVGRVAHGVSRRVDRLRGLGNAVVPAQAKEAFVRLMGLT